jgi:hypothetical protein
VRQGLFEEAVMMARVGPNEAGHQWYPYSYLCGQLLRRCAFLTMRLGQDASLGCILQRIIGFSVSNDAS